MLELEKVTHEDEELETKIAESLGGLEEGDFVEVLCYPMTDGCCIKSGTV